VDHWQRRIVSNQVAEAHKALARLCDALAEFQRVLDSTIVDGARPSPLFIEQVREGHEQLRALYEVLTPRPDGE